MASALCFRTAAPAPELGPASDPTSEIVRRPGEANISATTRAVQQRVPGRHSRQSDFVHPRYSPLPPRCSRVHGRSLCCIQYVNCISISTPSNVYTSNINTASFATSRKRSSQRVNGCIKVDAKFWTPFIKTKHHSSS
jgi:hypothetical protein